MSILRICSHRTRHGISSGCFLFLMSTSFSLLPWLSLLQWWCRHPFFLLLQAAERVWVALFSLPLLAPPLSILLADSLLLLHAADVLLLGRADHLSQLDGLYVVQGHLAGFVQHNGVEDYVEQRNTWDLLQTCRYCVVLEITHIKYKPFTSHYF